MYGTLKNAYQRQGFPHSIRNATLGSGEGRGLVSGQKLGKYYGIFLFIFSNNDISKQHKLIN